jgi:hypothetical protein
MPCGPDDDSELVERKTSCDRARRPGRVFATIAQRAPALTRTVPRCSPVQDRLYAISSQVVQDSGWPGKVSLARPQEVTVRQARWCRLRVSTAATPRPKDHLLVSLVRVVVYGRWPGITPRRCPLRSGHMACGCGQFWWSLSRPLLYLLPGRGGTGRGTFDPG